MSGLHKKIMLGIICATLALSLGQQAKVSDIIIESNTQSYTQKNENNKKNIGYSHQNTNTDNIVADSSKMKNISKTTDSDNDWIDKNGELKKTVIVDKEQEYYDNDNCIIIEYRNGVKEPAELSKYAEKVKDVDELIKVYKIKSKKDTGNVIKITKKYSSDIQIAQPDYTFSIASEDDEIKDYYKEGKQWALENDGTFESPETDADDANIKAVEDIDLNAKGAWEKIEKSQISDVKSKQVIVAVIDTGIDYTNAELKDVIWQNEDEVSDGKDSDNNGYKDDIIGWNFASWRGDNDVTDDNGHGTAVAGVIAAANDNNGVIGIASDINIKIMPVKSVDYNGDASMSDLIAGMRYADQNGASICNCSWGGEANDWEILQNMLMEQIIANSDMLFVAASGNETVDIDRKEYIPASFTADNLITVGSIEWDGSLSWFSNYGSSSMEICAPGAAIYTVNAGGGYVCEWGTSFSAPYVAGVAALAEAASGSSDGSILKNIICNNDNIKKISGLEKYCKYGGIPDAEKVVDAALKYRTSAETTVSPTPNASEASADTTKVPESTNTQTPDDLSDVKNTATPDIIETEEPKQTAEPKDASDSAESPEKTASPESSSSPSPDNTSNQKDDSVKISVKNSLYKGYARKIKIKVDGSLSQIKYSKGERSTSYFEKFGNDFVNVNDNNFTINAYTPGWYSVYVKTTGGTETVKKVFANVKIVKVSKTKLNIKKGSEYKLSATIKEQDKYPEKLKGKIYFKSSNKKIVSVNAKTGKIKAKAKGKAVVTAYTQNGKSAKCTVVCSK